MESIEKKSVTPILIDMGKTQPKKIKALKRGEGALMEDIQAVVAEVETQLGEEMNGKTLIPVIVLYKEKKKKRKRLGLLSSLLER